MGAQVTDPELLSQLNGVIAGKQPISDPHLLAQLNGPPATAADRVQAGEGGFLSGAAYLATALPDAGMNLFNLGRAGLGYGYSKLTGKDVPEPLRVEQGVSPIGHWLTQQMDKSPITTTQPTRPDDTLSRYISTAASAAPGALTGSTGGIGGTTRALVTGAVPAMAGQAVAEGKPFGDNDAANNAATIGTQLLASALMPRGKGADVPGNDVKNQTIRAAQDEGLVFPPAATNPSAGNRMIDRIGGKTAIAQEAGIHNQPIVNGIARRELGLEGTGSIDPGEIAEIRRTENAHYQAASEIPKVELDPTFKADVAATVKKFTSAGELDSALAPTDLIKRGETFQKRDSISGAAAVSAVGVLRDKANSAYRAGENGTGAAYSQMAGHLESAMERSMSSSDMDPSILQNWRAARERLAVAHQVENALSEGTGNVIATKLAGQLSNGVKLRGGLETVAKAAQATKGTAVFREPTSSPTNHTDIMVGALLGGLGGAAEHFMPGAGGWAFAPAIGSAAWTGARAGAKAYALSKPGQGNVIASQRGPINPLAAALLSSQPGLMQPR